MDQSQLTPGSLSIAASDVIEVLLESSLPVGNDSQFQPNVASSSQVQLVCGLFERETERGVVGSFLMQLSSDTGVRLASLMAGNYVSADSEFFRPFLREFGELVGRNVVHLLRTQGCDMIFAAPSIFVGLGSRRPHAVMTHAPETIHIPGIGALVVQLSLTSGWRSAAA